MKIEIFDARLSFEKTKVWDLKTYLKNGSEWKSTVRTWAGDDVDPREQLRNSPISSERVLTLNEMKEEASCAKYIPREYVVVNGMYFGYEKLKEVLE